MALNFGKKGAKSGSGAGEGTGKKVGFLKKGAEAQEAFEKEQKKIEEQQNQVYRFWLGVGAETQITFLDGNLDADGVLDCPMFHEHQVFQAGNWTNYTCVKEDEPCPICATGDQSKLVAVFTVIDHTEFTSKKTKKTYKDSIKLFACKQGTFKLLQKLATKRGGLTGITFDVSRSTDKSAGCGDMFDFVEKNTLEDLKKTFGTPDKLIEPLVYEEVIQYRTAEELAEYGWSSGKSVGKESDYSKEM